MFNITIWVNKPQSDKGMTLLLQGKMIFDMTVVRHLSLLVILWYDIYSCIICILNNDALVNKNYACYISCSIA